MKRLRWRARQAAAKTLTKVAAVAVTAARRAVSRRARGIAGLFAGGGAIAYGASMVYAPAGVILGGLELAAYCLLAFDVGEAK